MGRRRTLIVVCLVAALVGAVAGSAGSSAATGPLVRANGDIAFAEARSVLLVNPNVPGVRTVAGCAAGSGDCTVVGPAWSPSGAKLAFVSGVFALNHPSHMSLYVAAANGEGAKRLASCGDCGWIGSRLAWSPNGKWIVFSHDDFRTGREPLWIVAAAGGKPHRLTHCQTRCADLQPTWSPNGHLVLFEHSPRSGPPALFTIRPNGTDLKRIAAGGDPQWSPDGREIAFDPSPDSIAVAHADGSHVHVLLAGGPGSGPGDPSWSPDGKRLVFFWTPGTPSHFTAEVWTINADGTDQTRLYHSGCCVGFWGAPIWSPDGKMIAFSADSAGGTFVIKADGNGLKQLSSDSTAALSWQPR